MTDALKSLLDKLNSHVNGSVPPLPDGKEICDKCEVVVSTPHEHPDETPQEEKEQCPTCSKWYKNLSRHRCKPTPASEPVGELSSEVPVLFTSQDADIDYTPTKEQLTEDMAKMSQIMTDQGMAPVCVTDKEPVKEAAKELDLPVISEQEALESVRAPGIVLYIDCIPVGEHVHIADKLDIDELEPGAEVYVSTSTTHSETLKRLLDMAIKTVRPCN